MIELEVIQLNLGDALVDGGGGSEQILVFFYYFGWENLREIEITISQKITAGVEAGRLSLLLTLKLNN